MNFLVYLLLGGMLYVVGTLINVNILTKADKSRQMTIKDRIVWAYLAACCALLLPVSWLMERQLLSNVGTDWLYILVNTLVGVGVFFAGLTLSKSTLPPPEC